ncbi:MAG: septum formation protein Maf [Saprospiraceae bacterium]|nr:septum formation protein Maf [Saprospiraceae bacterium]
MDILPPVLDIPILLASQSPRRRQLLEAAGFTVTVRVAAVEEDFPPGMPAEEVAAYLAEKKAEAARSFLNEGAVLLAADSIVVLDGVIFGKPADADEARRILLRLSGRTHEVITGVCLLRAGKKRVFSVSTQVSMAPLDEAEIDYYIRRDRPFDKAGAYAIQEWIGLCKIERIEGNYSNVVGLPVERVYRELQEF